MQFASITTDDNLTIVTASAQVLGDLTVGGNLSLTTGAGGAGGVTQVAGSVLQVTGTTAFIADTAVDQDAVLDGASNNFTGAVSFTSLNDGSWRDLAVNDAVGNLALGTVEASRDVTLAAIGAIDLGTLTTGGNLDVSGNGNLEQQGAVVVGGTTSLQAGSGAITLTNAANDFNGAVSLSATAAAVTDSAGGVVLDQIDTTVGGLTVVSTNGAITQAASSVITTAADSSFSATTTALPDSLPADIVLNNTGNNFTGVLNLDGASIVVYDSNALTLGNVSAAGSLAITTNGGNVVLGETSVTQNMTVQTGGGSISQSGQLDVGGASNLSAGSGSITLTAANNQFAGTVDASGAAIVLGAADALTLGNVSSSSTLEIVSGGAVSLGTVSVGSNLNLTSATGGITQTGALIVTGQSAINAGSGNIVLADPDNEFTQAVTVRGQAITLATAGALILGDVNSGGDLTLTTTGGSISQAAGATLVAQGSTSLRAADNGSAAAVMLGNTGNNFVGVISAVGAAITLRDDIGSMKIGTITASGMLDAQATGGAIMLEPGTLQIALGGMRLTPDPRPMGIAYPTSGAESLRGSGQASSQAAPSSAPAATTAKVAAAGAGWSVVATEQASSGSANSGSNTTAVIKISEAPLSQADKNLIPVGKVFALSSGQSETKIIQSASFEILDGFTAGQATIEMGNSASIESSIDNAKGTVSVSGDASVADYDKVVQGINLRVNGDTSGNAVIRIRITLTDQNGQAESKVVTVRMNKPAGDALSLNN